MKNSFLVCLMACMLMGTTIAYTQTPPVQNLYFVKKNQPAVFDKEDYGLRKTAFYLYRNCVYMVRLRNKKEFYMRVVDIKSDSIYYTTYVNQNAAGKNHDRLDTLSLSPAQLKSIRLVADRVLGMFTGCSLRKCRYTFEQCTKAKAFPHLYDTVYTKDHSQSTVYEIVPYITAQGLDQLYEQCGKTYYYQGFTAAVTPCDSPKVNNALIRKKGLWFTPSNANEIRGVNIGLQTGRLDEDSISIRGVNLNADIMTFFLSFTALFDVPFNNNLINMPDTLENKPMQVRVKGLSISGGGLMFDTEAKGVIINGAICSVEKTNGLVITGSQNLIYGFKGVTISALRNKSTTGSGVQIGLLNICKHLKGVQIGLWNVNSKRRLPLINWGS